MSKSKDVSSKEKEVRNYPDWCVNHKQKLALDVYYQVQTLLNELRCDLDDYLDEIGWDVEIHENLIDKLVEDCLSDCYGDSVLELVSAPFYGLDPKESVEEMRRLQRAVRLV